MADDTDTKSEFVQVRNAVATFGIVVGAILYLCLLVYEATSDGRIPSSVTATLTADVPTVFVADQHDFDGHVPADVASPNRRTPSLGTIGGQRVLAYATDNSSPRMGGRHQRCRPQGLRRCTRPLHRS